MLCHIFKIGKSVTLSVTLIDVLAALSLQSSRYRVAAYVRAPHPWCRRDGCGWGRARVTIVHALQMHCQAVPYWLVYMITYASRESSYVSINLNSFGELCEFENQKKLRIGDNNKLSNLLPSPSITNKHHLRCRENP